MTETNGNRTLIERLEDLKKLNRSRFDFVIAYCDIGSVEGTLKEIGRSKGWYYGFTEEERKEIEDLATELHYEKVIQAQLIIQDAANEAAKIKIDGLKERDKRLRQQVATEILDRTIGKPGSNEKEKDQQPINITINLLESMLEKIYGNKE